MNKMYLLIALGAGSLLTSCATPHATRVADKNVRAESKPSPTIVKSVVPKGAKITTVISGDAQLGYDKTLARVRMRADAIVIGKPTQDFIYREHGSDYFASEDDGDSSQYLESEWTCGPFIVEQILYQKAGIGLQQNQVISLTESVALNYLPSTGATVRTITEGCTEIKNNSRYVLFINKGDNGIYGTHNYNLGRFNTDGTDIEDEMGIVNGRFPDGTKTDKQKLREELTAAYPSVTFAVPTTVAPSLTTLSPNRYAPSAYTGTFTLAVSGSDFKNGAVIRFDNKPQPTYFNSATTLLAGVSLSDVGEPGIVPVTVTNPDGQVSASLSFEVLPAVPNAGVVSRTWQRANGKVTVTQVAKNTSRVPVTDLRYTAAWITTLGASDRYDTLTALPVVIGDLAPGESRTFTLDFADTITPGANRLFNMNYSYSGKSGTSAGRATIP